MKRKVLSLLVIFIMSLGILVGCNNGSEIATVETEESTGEVATVDTDSSSDTDSEEGSYSVVDMFDREVVFEKEPERVIAIMPADAETINDLNATDKLVGIGSYVDYPEEILDLPRVATGQDMNSEEIISLDPDLLVMSDMATTKEQIDVYLNAGIKVIMTPADSIEDVYKSLEIVGNALNKETEATDKINQLKVDFEKLAENKEQNQGKTVYFEVSPLEYGLWTAGNNTFMQEISDILGLTNIFEDVDGWAEVSEEEVISRNPDYIVTIAMAFDESVSPIDEILQRPGWQDISAIKNNKILNLQNDELSRPSSRLLEGANALSEFVSE